MGNTHSNGLLGELRQLAKASETGNFTGRLELGDLSGEERKAARLFNKILKNYQAAMKYGLMKNKLTGKALGIAYWDMEIRNSDPIDPNNLFFLSQECRQMLGFTDESDFPNLLSSWSSRLHPGDKARVLKAFAAHIADHTGGTPYSQEYRLAMKNGEYRYFRAIGATIRDKAGRPLRVAGALEDITGQRQLMEKVREAEERVQTILNTSPLSLTVWDKEQRLIDCSHSAVKLFGFADKQAFLERHACCLPELQPDGRRSLEVLANEMARAFETGYGRLEWTQRTANGDLGVFDLWLVRVQYQNDQAMMIYARDIRKDQEMLTELVQRDELLAAQSHWYKSILDAIPLPLNVVDPDMNLVFANSAAEKFFSKNRTDLLGLPCCRWNAPICDTENCSIARMKQGFKQTFFKHNGRSCQVDIEIIRDAMGEPSGFLEILHDVTDVEKMARRQADEANEAKNVFLATVSHEMRTPLNAVIGLSELTLSNGGLDEEAETNIENVYSAGSTLLSIVNDILDFSKIKSGKFEIIPGKYDVPSLVNDAVAQNIIRIGSKPIRFVLDIDENMPVHLYGDDLRIRQIIGNLLSNAFKYTEKGKVTLALYARRESEVVWLSIQVSDTGVGILPEHHARLFSDYSQVDAKANRKAGGTGLGLSITRNLAALMDGNITVASTYGQGSVFTVKIRQGFVDDAIIGAKLAESLRNFSYVAGKRRRNSRLERARLSYARVLVVDDHQSNLDVAKGLMRPYGMRIDCVTSGQEAIEAITAGEPKYNAIFMDHMMPGLDGVEATRRIRELGSDYARGMPIIAFTANAIAGNEELFLRNGFNAVLFKPIDLARLDEVLQRFVRDKKREALLAEDKPEADRQEERRRPGHDRREGKDRRASGGKNGSALLELGRHIGGLDIAEGLERFGDEASYTHILRSYAKNTRPLLESISKIDLNSMSDYAITVHGLKSSSRGICADSAGRLAEGLEHAAKSGDFDFVREHHPAFLESVRNLVDGIETLLAELAENSDRPRKDKPDSALLARLQTACDDYDMDGVDAAMAEIAAFDYESEPGLVDWLRENIIRLNFEQIKEKIVALR